MKILPSSDDDSFETELRLAQVPVLGYLIRLSGNLADAEDLLQMANVTAWEKREEFESGSNFVAWLCTIGRNHYLNHSNKSQRHQTVPLLDSDVEKMVENRHQEREQEETRKRRLLQICLERLIDRQREFVEEFYLQGKTLRELADDNRMNANAVAQILHRARQNLIDCVRMKSHSVLDSDTF